VSGFEQHVQASALERSMRNGLYFLKCSTWNILKNLCAQVGFRPEFLGDALDIESVAINVPIPT
jgi:hypothetical protein